MEHWKNYNIENIEGEIWVTIPQFKYYMCSSFGRVKSLPKNKVRSRTGNFITKEKILRQKVTKWGYTSVYLYNDSGKYFKTVHRLVLLCFVENKECKPQGNHKNGIKTDNKLDNLEWATRSENMIHSFKVLNRKPSLNGLGRSNEKHSRSLPILCITTNKKYPSVSEASRQLKIPTTNISKVMMGKRKSALGLVFQYL